MAHQPGRHLLAEALLQHPLRAPEAPPNVPQNTKAQVAEECAIHAMETERRLRDLKLADHRNRIDNRRKYTARLYGLMVAWIAAVLLILVFNATLGPHPDRAAETARCPVYFTLPESVLLALVGGTTANVIGLFFVVAKYLFPAKDDEQ